MKIIAFLSLLLTACGASTRVARLEAAPEGPVEVVFAEYDDALQLDPKSSRFGERLTEAGPRWRLRWHPAGHTTWLGRDFGDPGGVRGQPPTRMLPAAPPGGTSLAAGEGAVLYVIPGEAHLRLRLADGRESVVNSHAFSAAATPGFLWIQASGPEVVRIDTTTGVQTALTLEPPFLLGRDAAGYLWLAAVDQVEAGAPLPVVRWHPGTDHRTHLILPTRP